DGLVFVADSQPSRMDANLESLQNLRDNLREHGLELSKVPHVFQYNKRDLDDVVAIDELERALNAHKAPALPTWAALGDGMYEALETIARLVLDSFEEKAPALEPSFVPRLDEDDGGLAAVLRSIEPTTGTSVAPKATPPSPQAKQEAV